MPFVRAPSGSPVARYPRLRLCLRFMRYAALTLVVGFLLLLLAVRFIVFPELQNNRARVADMIAGQISQPVEIDALVTSWDGWNPKLDVRGMRIIDPVDRKALLELPQVSMKLSWSSLAVFELRFEELTLTAPQLALRRDAAGLLHVAGITIDPVQQGGDARISDWLLRQPRIVIRNALVSWLDEKRQAPQLLLEHVDFRLDSAFGRHRFGLRANPPAELASPLDIRGDLRGNTTDEGGFNGRLYTRLDFVDIAAWTPWLTLPIAVVRGKGGLRAWVDVARNAPTGVIADLVLADVEARLRPDLPELVLPGVQGRAGWRENSKQTEVFTQQLTFSGPQGVRFDPTDLKLVMTREREGQITGGTLDFDHVQLEPLQRLASFLPLSQAWRDDLDKLAPRGRIDRAHLSWEGDAASPTHYAASAAFADLGFDAREAWPGVTGAIGSFEATESRGEIKLRSRAMKVELARWLAEPIILDGAEGEARWQRSDGGFTLDVDRLAVANTDAAGTGKATYRSAREGLGSLDLNVLLTRADLPALHRYIPTRLPVGVRDWLRTGLTAGGARDVHFKVAGNLSEFPFADGKKGQFLVTAKGEGITVDYAPGWPSISDAVADLRIEGTRLIVDGQHARIFGAALTGVRVEIPEMHGPHPALRIDGKAAGSTQDMLRFIAESPIQKSLAQLPEHARASGNGSLSLKLELPLGDAEDRRLSGDYTFADNQIVLGGGIPVLDQVRGTLSFSERGVDAPAITAEVLGGSARLGFSSENGSIRIKGQGVVKLESLVAQYPQMVFADRVSGSTDWSGVLTIGRDASQANIDSSLKGVAIKLPVPAGKPAADTVPLKVQWKTVDATHDAIEVHYGSTARVSVSRRANGDDMVPERAVVALGSSGAQADRRGLWIRGDTPALDLASWLSADVNPAARKDAVGKEVRGNSGTDASPAGLQLEGMDVRVGALDVFGRRLRDMQVNATRDGRDWQLELNGNDAAGSGRWEAPGEGRPNGRIRAHLSRMHVPATIDDNGNTDGAKPPAGRAGTEHAWPEIDLVADSFIARSRDLGKLEVVAQPQGTDWRIQRLNLASEDGVLDARGLWRSTGKVETTELITSLNVVDAGKFLHRLGLPDAVRGGATRIDGQLAWAGGPQDFDYPSLSGAFRIETGPGQFTKVDPGIGKLLGVLSLQSLRRRLALDFQDVFGEGFAFDEIKGDVRILNGLMRSDNLRIAGPSAHVVISGETDIAHETQRLKMLVQPSLSASLSVGAAALLLANPIVGAAVGAGTLLAQKVLKDPIEKMFSYEYAVSGSWSDPVVDRVGGVGHAAPPPVSEAPAR